MRLTTGLRMRPFEAPNRTMGRVSPPKRAVLRGRLDSTRREIPKLSPHASAGSAHPSSGSATVAYRMIGLLPNLS
eukprot:5264481-Heterocapsa_arctica.AAC.1